MLSRTSENAWFYRASRERREVLLSPLGYTTLINSIETSCLRAMEGKGWTLPVVRIIHGSVICYFTCFPFFFFFSWPPGQSHSFLCPSLESSAGLRHYMEAYEWLAIFLEIDDKHNFIVKEIRLRPWKRAYRTNSNFQRLPQHVCHWHQRLSWQSMLL